MTSIAEYQKFTQWTAVYPEKGTGSLVAVTYCALGLGEAGEVQGKVKKIWRGDVTLFEQKQAILLELGDQLWYITRMADECGSSLQEVMDQNHIKLKDRHERNVIRGSSDYR